jgi:hypothetical protein
VFPELRNTSLRGAPGLVTDSLPGRFADLLTNAWLARHGIQPGQITVVDRLGYVGDHRTGGRPPSGVPADAGQRRRGRA